MVAEKATKKYSLANTEHNNIHLWEGAMINGTVVSTRIGFDADCRFRCTIYLLSENNCVHRIPFALEKIEEFLTKMDISCWERVVHTALRFEPQGEIVKHITRDVTFVCEN